MVQDLNYNFLDPQLDLHILQKQMDFPEHQSQGVIREGSHGMKPNILE